ncbi:MAG: EpsG family protein [Rikenellaceae bacterium]|nr:EpsG family protein [Rikenellaceae bacterium]
MAISATLKAGHHPISKTKVLVVALFIIYPLGALPFILIEIYNQKKYAFTLLALFMGLCSILMAPSGDLYRHTMNYIAFKGMDFPELIGTYIKFDFTLYTVSFLLAKLSLHFELARGLFAFVGFQCIFWAFRDVVKHNPTLQASRKWCFIGFLVAFCVTDFFILTLGMRHGLATYLMVLGIYKLFRCRQANGWCFVILSGLTHFALVPFAALAVVMRVFPFRLNKWFVIAISGFIIIFSTTILESVINALALPEMVKQHALYYVSGYWGNEFLEDRSQLYRIYRVLYQLVIYPLIVVFFINYKAKTYTPFKGFLMAGSLLLFLTFPLSEVFARVAALMLPLYVFDLLLGFTLTKPAIRWMRIIVFFTCISICSQVYSFRRHLIHLSRIHALAYSPAPCILWQTFDERWIHKHINPDGSFDS